MSLAHLPGSFNFINNEQTLILLYQIKRAAIQQLFLKCFSGYGFQFVILTIVHAQHQDGIQHYAR
jgi:hypothetical protein